jgi:ABC-type dipeptide/oligopeptide/nickel transport system permease component
MRPGLRPRGILDRVTTLGGLAARSATPFWLGLMLPHYLAGQPALLPLSGTGHLLIIDPRARLSRR